MLSDLVLARRRRRDFVSVWLLVVRSVVVVRRAGGRAESEARHCPSNLRVLFQCVFAGPETAKTAAAAVD